MKEFRAGGVLLKLSNPYPIPDHVQLILQPCTRLVTKNPHPIPDLLFLELLVENHLPTILQQLFLFPFREGSFSSEFQFLF